MKQYPIIRKYSGNNKIVEYKSYYHIYGEQLVKRAISLLESANKSYIKCYTHTYMYIQVKIADFPVTLTYQSV